MPADAVEGFYVPAGDGEPYPFGGGGVATFKVRGEDTGGHFEITENAIPPGHPGTPRTFITAWIMRGTSWMGWWTSRLGTASFTLDAGPASSRRRGWPTGFPTRGQSQGNGFRSIASAGGRPCSRRWLTGFPATPRLIQQCCSRSSRSTTPAQPTDVLAGEFQCLSDLPSR